MKAVGIIVEYNPFHYGHLYHLNACREKFPEAVIVAIMSGNFVQRGELSLLSKEDKTHIALHYGVDLVVELPYFYSTQSAELFARGAVMHLKALQVEALYFGCETEELSSLEKSVDYYLVHREKIHERARFFMAVGCGYPTAMTRAFQENGVSIEWQPNTILAFEYIKAIKECNTQMQFFALKRHLVGYHSLESIGQYASATLIRRKIKSLGIESVTSLIPEETQKRVKYRAKKSEELFFALLYYRLTHLSEGSIQDMEKGLFQRLKQAILKQKSYETFFQAIKTKRYTDSRLRRVLLHLLLELTKEQSEEISWKIPYIMILGSNQQGRNYLSSIKKTQKNITITNHRHRKKLITWQQYYFDLACRADELYSFLVEETRGTKPILY